MAYPVDKGSAPAQIPINMLFKGVRFTPSCILCKKPATGSLRNVFPNPEAPDTSTFSNLLKSVLNIDITTIKKLKPKYCLSCAKSLTKMKEHCDNLKMMLDLLKERQLKIESCALLIAPTPVKIVSGKLPCPSTSVDSVDTPEHNYNHVKSAKERDTDEVLKKEVSDSETAPEHNYNKIRPVTVRITNEFLKGTVSDSETEPEQNYNTINPIKEGTNDEVLNEEVSDSLHTPEHNYSKIKTVKERATAEVLKKTVFDVDAHNTSSLPTAHIQKIKAAVEKTDWKTLADLVFSSPEIMKHIERNIIVNIESTCDRLCSLTRKPGPSVLRTYSTPKFLLEKNILAESALEFSTHLTFAKDVVKTLCSPLHIDKANTTNTVGMIYGMAMHCRNPQLCAVQKLNTSVAVRNHSSNELINIFSQSCFTTPANSKALLVDTLGKFIMDGVTQSLKMGIPGKLAVDKMDGPIIANQLRLNQQNNNSAASADLPDGVDVSNLSPTPPQVPAKVGPDLSPTSPQVPAKVGPHLSPTPPQVPAKAGPDLSPTSPQVPAKAGPHLSPTSPQVPVKGGPSCTGNLKSHKPIHTRDRPYKCEVCDKRFAYTVKLKNHMRNHTGEKPYKCERCDRRFTDAWYLKMHLRVHMRNHTGEKPFKCESCDRRFTDAWCLKAHMRVHTALKKYSCEQCDEKFTHSSHLKSHMKTHARIKAHRCGHCGMCFDVFASMMKHMRIHTGEKPHKCMHCDKRFDQAGKLKIHMRKHNGEKPYLCQRCGVSFAVPGSLNRHMRIHTGERPHKCELCDKRYPSLSEVKRHLRTHTGEKPHKCELCDKSFNETSKLKIHMRKHTGEKPYLCQHCGMGFAIPGSLKKHMRIHTEKK